MSSATRSPFLRLRSNRRRLLCLLAVPGWHGMAGLMKEVALVISRPAPHFRRLTVYKRIANPPTYPTEGPWAA